MGRPRPSRQARTALMTRRSQVHILPPPPCGSPGGSQDPPGLLSLGQGRKPLRICHPCTDFRQGRSSAGVLFAYQADGPIVDAHAMQGPIHRELGIAMDMSIQLRTESGASSTHTDLAPRSWTGVDVDATSNGRLTNRDWCGTANVVFRRNQSLDWVQNLCLT